MRKLSEEFKHFRGQPIEVITKGVVVCGVDCESDEDAVTLIDRKGRFIRVENRHVEAVVEPQMRLHRLCERFDCECEHHDHDRDNDHDRDCDCD